LSTWPSSRWRRLRHDVREQQRLPRGTDMLLRRRVHVRRTQQVLVWPIAISSGGVPGARRGD
jgi:hypothetical protein